MPCKVEGCNNIVFAKGLCSKHYSQLKRHGKIDITRFDKNEFITYTDYSIMIVYYRNLKQKAKVIIDTEDIGKLKLHKWYLKESKSQYNYITTKENQQEIKLNHFIYGNIPKGYLLTYKNNNFLDNRKENLTILPMKELRHKGKTPKNNKSTGYKGVTKQIKNGKWTGKYRAYITHEGQRHNLGTFDNLEDAIKSRHQAEKDFGWN